MTPTESARLADVERRLRAAELDLESLESRVEGKVNSRIADAFDGFKRIAGEALRVDVANGIKAALDPYLPKFGMVETAVAMLGRYPELIDLLHRSTNALAVHEKVERIKSEHDLKSERIEIAKITSTVEVSKSKLAVYSALGVALVGLVGMAIGSYFRIK